MKRVFFGASVILICFGVACKKQNFLDKTATTDLDETAVFSDSSRSMDFLTNIYANIDFSFSLARFNGAAGLDEPYAGTGKCLWHEQWFGNHRS